jgi:hypothetical protein
MLTKETIKGMKKKELIELAIGDQNRLEYLHDKTVGLQKENERFQKGLEELQMAADIMLKQVAYLYGGKGKKIRLRPIPDLGEWDAEIDRNEATKEMTVKLQKKEGA